MDLTNIKGMQLPPICSVLKFNIQLWFELTQVTLDVIAKYLKRLIGGTKNVRKKMCKIFTHTQGIFNVLGASVDFSMQG